MKNSHVNKVIAIDAGALAHIISNKTEYALIDIREAGLYGEEHILAAVSIPYSKMELLIPARIPNRNTKIVLVGPDDDTSRQAARHLMTMGYKNIAVLAGGMDAWVKSGRKSFAGVNVITKGFAETVEHTMGTPHITPEALATMQTNGEPVIILDGRTYAEHEHMSIPGSISVPNGELIYRFHDLVPDETIPVVIHCAGRTRSLIGAQTLINAGVANPVSALKDGTMGWRMAGYTFTVGDKKRFSEVSEAGLRWSQERVAQMQRRYGIVRVSFSELESLMKDPLRTCYLLDVRTLEEYQAGHISGAVHAHGGQLVHALDEWCAVRNALIILVDEGNLVRATTSAHWLMQQGWDTRILDMSDGAPSMVEGLSKTEIPAFIMDSITWVDVSTLAASIGNDNLVIIDVGSSALFQERRIPTSRWCSRVTLRETLSHIHPSHNLIFVGQDGQDAALAAFDCTVDFGMPCAVLRGGITAWLESNMPVDTTTLAIPSSERIDFLYWNHDRHLGNDDAANAYLAWEHSLLSEVSADDACDFSIK